MENLAYSWLFIFYNLLGLVLLVQGAIWLFYPAPFYQFLISACKLEYRPQIFVKTAYALLFFGTITLIAAFMLRSGADMLFGIGLMTVSYILIRFLNHWDRLRTIIPDKPEPIKRFLRQMGFFTLVISVVVMLLIYHLVLTGP